MQFLGVGFEGIVEITTVNGDKEGLLGGAPWKEHAQATIDINNDVGRESHRKNGTGPSEDMGKDGVKEDWERGSERATESERQGGIEGERETEKERERERDRLTHTRRERERERSRGKRKRTIWQRSKQASEHASKRDRGREGGRERERETYQQGESTHK